MKAAKPKSSNATKRLSADEIRRAFAERAEEVTADYVFRPRHVWQVVAISMPTIEKLVLREKRWDEIAKELRLASGFAALAGQSIRVYRSRLKNGDYDDKLGELGLQRIDDRIVPIEGVGDSQVEKPRAPAAERVVVHDSTMVRQPGVQAKLPQREADAANALAQTTIRVRPDPE